MEKLCRSRIRILCFVAAVVYLLAFPNLVLRFVLLFTVERLGR